MASYETLFVVRPDIDEEDLHKVVVRVEDIVKSSEGTVLESEVWGKRRLAYEVRTYSEGIYVRVSFDAPPAVVKQLRDYFRLHEDVIRDLIVQQESARDERHEATEYASAVEENRVEDDED